MPEQREGEALLQRDLEIASKVYRAEYERHQQTKAALAASQERERQLREALAEARPYVYGVATEHRDNWRGQTAAPILLRIDVALDSQTHGGSDD